MTVRLRPHHLLCLLTYAGKGYTPAFTANFDAIAGRVGAGEEIEVVSGPDDICAPLLDGGDHHCLLARITDRDRSAARDVGALLDQPVTDGLRLTITGALLIKMRAAFRQGTTRAACGGCDWNSFCTIIAQDYRESLLR